MVSSSSSRDNPCATTASDGFGSRLSVRSLSTFFRISLLLTAVLVLAPLSPTQAQSSRLAAPSTQNGSKSTGSKAHGSACEISDSHDASQYARGAAPRDGSLRPSTSVSADKAPDSTSTMQSKRNVTESFARPESEKSHSNTTSPSTDGTIASGFTEEIVGDCLAKISFKDGDSQSIYLNKNSTLPQWLVYLFHLPKGLAYDRILNVVSRFGDTKIFNWTPLDPTVCEVMYLDPFAAENAVKELDGSSPFVSKATIRAKLRATNPNHQVIASNLPSSVTEEVLESLFTELVGCKAYAILRKSQDSKNGSQFAFLSFTSVEAVQIAVEKGAKLRIDGKPICVYEFASCQSGARINLMNLSHNVTVEALEELFDKFVNIEREDISIYRRSYAFTKFKTREGAESAKRDLNRTDLKGPIIVRYAEAEQNKTCISVQFHNAENGSVDTIRQATVEKFSEYGKCSIEFEFTNEGVWRRLAFVTYDSDVESANALLSVTKVGGYSVWCQWARELIPRMPPKCLHLEKHAPALPKEGVPLDGLHPEVQTTVEHPTPFMPAAPPPTPANPNSTATDGNFHGFGSHNPGYNTNPMVNGTPPVHHGVPYANPYMYPAPQMDMVQVMMPHAQAQLFQQPEMYYSAPTYYWNSPGMMMHPNSYLVPGMYPHPMHHHMHMQPAPMPFFPNPSAAPYEPRDIPEEGSNPNGRSNAGNNENMDPARQSTAGPQQK